MRKRLLSLLCVLALTAGLFILPAAADGVTLTAQGWLETICAEVSGVTKDQITSVTWTGPTSGSMTSAQSAADREHGAFSFEYLVRDMTGGGVRIDIPGLKAGDYTLTVTAGGTNYTESAIAVKAHDRSGFAHWQHTTDSDGHITGIERYTEGVGAYNDDGTLKDNALVVYVTDENKDAIVFDVSDEYRSYNAEKYTGIGNLLNSGAIRATVRTGNDKDGHHHEGQPLAFRFVGTVTAPKGVSEPRFALEKGSTTKYDGSNGFMCYIMSGKNMTIEGIGDDATIDGWGLSFGADTNDAKEGLAKNFELRNLTFRNVPEDCIEIAGRENGTTHELTCPVEHAWVHNSSFHVPDIPLYKAPATPADGTPYTWVDDKQEGDGATDVKCAQYVTYAYNHYDSYHKTGLIGGGDEQLTYHLTYHHNYYYNVDQRCPLARRADIHLYDNTYEQQRGYCVSLRASTYVFSEYNTFLNCVNPVVNEGSGGVCKSFNDVFTYTSAFPSNKGKTINAVIVPDTSTPVASDNPYAGFEADEKLSYIPSGSYLLDNDAAEAQKMVRAYAGAMKALSAVTHPTVHTHTFGPWVILSQVSCVTAGSRYRVCSAGDCTLADNKQTLASPALGHGYKDGKCVNCGMIDTLMRETLDPADIKGIFSLTTGAQYASSRNANFSDGKLTGCVDTNGKRSATGNSLQIDVPSDNATLKIWWTNGSTSAERSLQLFTSSGSSSEVAKAPASSSPLISETTLATAGTYYLGSSGGKVYIYKVEVTMQEPKLLSGKTLGTGTDQLAWSCTQDGTLNVEGYLPDGDVILAGLWNGDKLAGAKVLDNKHMGVETGDKWTGIQLFRLDGDLAPRCAPSAKETPSRSK